eukprot:3090484-Pyramimonas_sp.AAC.1
MRTALSHGNTAQLGVVRGDCSLAPPFGHAVREVGHGRRWVAADMATLDENSKRPLRHALASHSARRNSLES